MRLSPEGFGPLALGAPGAEVLKLKGAERIAPDCPCNYNVQLKDAGLIAQIGAVGGSVCGIIIEDPARYQIPTTIGGLADRYGAPQEEEATGDIRFNGAPWLAANLESPGAEGDLAVARVRSVLIGGCGE